MEQDTKECTSMVPNTEMVNTSIAMEQYTMESGPKTNSAAMASRSGQVEKFIMVSGQTATQMALVCSSTTTKQNIMASSRTIKNMDMEFINGMTGGNTKAGGLEVSNMASESTQVANRNLCMVCGHMASACIGSMMNRSSLLKRESSTLMSSPRKRESIARMAEWTLRSTLLMLLQIGKMASTRFKVFLDIQLGAQPND